MTVNLVPFLVSLGDLDFAVKVDEKILITLNKCVAAQAAIQDPLAFLLSDKEYEDVRYSAHIEFMRLIMFANHNAAGDHHRLWLNNVIRLANTMIAQNYSVGYDEPHAVFRLQVVPSDDLKREHWHMFVEAVLARAAVFRIERKELSLPASTMERAYALANGYVKSLAHCVGFNSAMAKTVQTWQRNVDAAAEAYIVLLLP